MIPEIDKLFKVLDLPREEQRRFFYCADSPYFDIETKSGIVTRQISFADLAYRLRAEADWSTFNIALQMVWKYWCDSSWSERKKKGENKKHISFHRFWLFLAKSIHWIIAALIAKELAKEKQ